MNGKRTRFEVTDGKIILIAEHLVWGEWQPLFTEDVTDEIKLIVEKTKEIQLN